MRDANAPVLREFETWLSLFTGEEIGSHGWKAWFCVAEYERPDFERVADLLPGGGSFAFLGRDAEEQADIIRALDDAGQEVAFHSHRHHAYGDLSYEEASDAITTGMAAIEDASGVSPDGFFAPFLDLSDGAVDAIEDEGFDWVLGRTDRDPAGVEIVEPVIPFDTRLLEEHDPEEAMAILREDAREGGKPFLFHPPVVEYHDGWDAFAEWAASVEPTTVANQIAGDGTGVVLDCVRPVGIR